MDELHMYLAHFSEWSFGSEEGNQTLGTPVTPYSEPRQIKVKTRTYGAQYEADAHHPSYLRPDLWGSLVH